LKSLLTFLESQKLTKEFKRLYHGRGEKEFRFLTIDSIDNILFVQFYEKTPFEKEILENLKHYINNTHHNTIIVKKRYSNETFAYVGEIPEKHYAIENGFKFLINFYNQNIGYFGDMKIGREYIQSISKDKNILNLFAYTCGFSLFARKGGAKQIINVDMNKSVLATGLKNHQINNLNTKNISFWPYNILKSFPKLQKKAPYDIIIIDPPTYQKGSFIASIDYIKIIKKLHLLSHEKTTLLACINSPTFNDEDLIEMIEKNSGFRFKKKLPNPKEYVNSTLKSLVFN